MKPRMSVVPRPSSISPSALAASSVRRLVMAFVAVLVATLVPLPALAVSLMDPFNLPAAMDSGVTRLGEGIAYADGPRKHLDVYAPDGLQGLAPVVFFIYGGAWDHGDRADYQFVGRALASRGFVTVIADYRLYPDTAYPGFLEDNAQALRWVQDNIAAYHGDINRLFLAGHSAGAYNAVMLALDSSFFREYGVTLDIKGVAALSGPYDFYPFEFDQVRHSFADAPNPEGTQPVNLVTQAAPPMLLASGTFDPIVKVQNTEHLAQALQQQGVWVTTKYYANAGHMQVIIAMGAMCRWMLPVLDDVVGFFTRFGAFPSGAPYFPAVPPTPPETTRQPLNETIARLDAMLAPIDQPGH